MEAVFWLKVMFWPVVAYCTVTESDAHVPVEAQTVTEDVPCVMPVSVSTAPERFAWTTLGFEFEET